MDPTFRVWDIHVKTNPFALNPTNFTIIPNTLEANASITELEISHCVNGRGIGCDKDDGPGVVHSATFGLGAAPPPPFPINGTLFTISYVAGVGNSSAVHIFDDFLGNGVFALAHSSLDGGYGINSLPTVRMFTAVPSFGVAAPVNVTFSGTVTDADNDSIRFTLDFGDATTVASGSTASACAGTLHHRAYPPYLQYNKITRRQTRC